MRTALVLLMIVCLGCGGETATETTTTRGAGEDTGAPKAPPPGVAEAETLVANSPEFSEYQFTHAAYSLAMQESAMTTPARDVADRLAKAGWIGIDGDGRVVLTEKAQKDKRFLVRPNGFMDIVPLARKEVTGVDTVAANDQGQPVVGFRWKWVPNEIGELFGPRYEGEQHADATLLWDGSKWTVLRVAPRTPPS